MRGEKNKAAKLTPDAVVAIRYAAARKERQADIARRFGIAQTTVSEIHRRLTWGWI